MASAKGQAVGLTASAARIDIGKRNVKLRTTEDWQVEAFQFAKTIPELRQSVLYVGNQMAKLRLIVGYKENESAVPIDIHSSLLLEEGVLTEQVIAICDAELSRLKGSTGGTADILKRMARNIDIAGECYLVGWEADPIEGTPEEWRCCSVREVEKKGANWYIKADPAEKRGKLLNPDTSTVIRIWEKDDEYAELASSTIQGVRGEARLLQILSQQVMAMALRALSNGVLLVPNDLSFGSVNAAEPEDGAEATVDPFLQNLEEIFMGPIEDPGNPNTVQPGLIRGDKESMKPEYFRHLSFYDKDQDAALEAKLEAHSERLARGINLPVEVVMGHMETTYANAAQIDQSEFDDFLQPRCVVLVDGLTIGFLRPNLLEDGLPPELVEKLVVWYDPDDLIAEPDQEKNADGAHDRFTISDKAYRAAKGFDEGDAPDPLEVIIRAGLRRGIFTAQLTQAMIQPEADEAGVELPSQEALAPGGPPVEGEASSRAEFLAMLELIWQQEQGRAKASAPIDVVSAAARPAATNYGRRLADIDRDLRSRLVVAANDAMTRALEKAGNVLRSKAPSERATLKNVPAHLRFATLGPTVSARFVTTDEALEGAWDELERQFRAWGAAAQAEALETASRVAGGFTVAEREQLQLRQAADLDEAWQWLRQSLMSLAGEKLFTPEAGVAAVGEFDPTLKVPTGMIRHAIARAGGGAGLTTNGAGGAFVTLTDAGTRPAGGIGTGELLREAMRDNGVQTEAYQWDYGPAFRKNPFEPHLSLDGVVFENFDDPVLTNTSGFPDVAFYMPGDHAGCICDFSPILIPVSESTGRGSEVADEEGDAA